MKPMHRLLKRQLEHHFGDAASVPPEWQAFVNRVNETYQKFDADRAGLEHSLALSARELSAANSEMQAVFQAIPDLVLRLDHNATILDLKAGATGDLMVARQHWMGKRLKDTPLHSDAHQFSDAIPRVLAENSPVSFEYSSVLPGGESHYEARLVPLSKTELIVMIRNITERKRLEAQLLQSQKLETVGRLVGGVAHEFNSLLTAIIGQSELLLEDLSADDPLSENAAQIRRVADRAATLTRQLLAYGRKQILRPEPVNLNEVVGGMKEMLRQLVGGEKTAVSVVPAQDLQWVKADAGKIEQVIMNIAINALHAMPNGGKLTLQTANVTFDEESVGRDAELKPGDYVMLAITDTGTGMSEKVKARAFEPFFTTKGIGQGTGLGLSTCQGIIKQSDGHISIFSEPGRGTTLKIYLPQMETPVKISPQRATATA